MQDISAGTEASPIYISCIPPSLQHFTYITDSQLGHGTQSSIHPALTSSGEPSASSTQQDPSEEDDEDSSDSDNDDVWACMCSSGESGRFLCTVDCGEVCDCVGQFGNFYRTILPTTNGIRNQILNLDALPDKLPLVECSPQCPCSEDCFNRVTQRGVRVPLTIRQTNTCVGLGLFYTPPSSATALPRGSFIALYAGEYLTPAEAQHRWQTLSPTAHGEGNYTLSLRLPDETIHIDPRYKGNVGRFLNHSCEANCVLHYVRWGGGKGRPRVAIFTARDLKSGEELTFDYANASGQAQRAKALQSSQHTGHSERDGRTKCLCGARSCRGWMPFDESL